MSDASDFSPEETRGLQALLDTLIPPSEDGRMPGAGEAGVLSYLAQRAAELRPLLLQGLSALDALAERGGAADFASLGPAERAATLAAHAESEPVLLPALIFHAYCGYYQQQPVVEALGLPYRPPFPEGYELAPTDASLLDRVRELPPLYREP